jgi:hypothetical protein
VYKTDVFYESVMHGLIVCIVWVSTAMRIENIVLITALLNGALSSETAAEQQCPFLQDFNWTQQCVCTHAATYRYECESQEIPVGFCMTYNESTDSLHSGLCPYDPDFTGNITLDETKNIVLKRLKWSNVRTFEQGRFAGPYWRHSTILRPLLEAFHCIEAIISVLGPLLEAFHCIEALSTVLGPLLEAFHCIEALIRGVPLY